jgi:hypothetical protein
VRFNTRAWSILAVTPDKSQQARDNPNEQKGKDDFSGVSVRKMMPMANRANKMFGFGLFISAQIPPILT